MRVALRDRVCVVSGGGDVTGAAVEDGLDSDFKIDFGLNFEGDGSRFGRVYLVVIRA